MLFFLAEDSTGIHELRYKAHILHRDISLGNLMYEELREGFIQLILNDFDHAVMVDDRGCPAVPNSLKHPAGTLPFVAHELLDPDTSVAHYVRHDFESVFLVALWLLIKFSLRTKATTEEASHLQQQGRDILQGWACGSVGNIYSHKQAIFTNPTTISKITRKVAMGPYKDWVTGFCRVFIKAYQVLNNLTLKADSAPEPVRDLNSDSESDWDSDSDSASGSGSGPYSDSDSDSEGAREITDMETLDGRISRRRIQKVMQDWEKGKRKIIKDFVPRFRVKRRKTAS